MEIKVVVKHGEVRADSLQTIEQKVRKLPRFFDRATSITVIVDLAHSAEPKVEIKISAEERDDFFAMDTGANVLAATDKVIDKIERQLRRHKEKITDHRGREDRRFEGAELPSEND